MTPIHFNRNSLPPISNEFWLWIRTSDDQVIKVKRVGIIPNKDHWEWPCITIDGENKIFKVIEWAYN